MKKNLDSLRDAIADCLAFEKSYNLPSVCTKYGLDEGDGDEAFKGKARYVLKRLKSKNEDFLVPLAKKLVDDYQYYKLGYALNSYQSNKYYLLTELTRRSIVSKVSSLSNISGKISAEEFLLKIGLSGLEEPGFMEVFLGQEEEIDSLRRLLNGNEIYQILDSQFFKFIEYLVHPVVRCQEETQEYLEIINPIILRDGFELIEVDEISEQSIYQVIRRDGVKGVIKNLIFASIGYKPEIVLEDALNNDVKIVANENSCLVYNRSIGKDGLKWIDLVDWWSSIQGKEKSAGLAANLYDRLESSLSSKPEKEFFKAYYNHYSKKLGKRLPALIPQIYLHYDPYSIRKYGIQYLLRQRMDFLILFSNSCRVVIEIDGKQHYSEGDKSSPEKYSEMVKLDRDLKFLNYDVYRLGGHELTYDLKTTTIDFFDKIFEKYL